jgi:hypothetical protein
MAQFLGGRIILGTEFAGYKWAFWEPGTSTPKITYKDSGLTVSNENLATVIADANGAAQIWFSGNADVTFYTPTNVVVYTDDDINLTETSSATGEANLALNPSFEDDTDADGIPNSWTRALFTGGTFLLDTTETFNGAVSAKFVSIGTGGGTLTSTNQFAVSPSIIYTVGFAIKSTVADVRNVVEIFWFKKDGTASATVSTSIYDNSTTNPVAWTEKWAEVTSPSDAAFAQIKLTGCSSSDATSGTTRFDDVKFSRFILKNAPEVFTFSTDQLDVCNGRLTLTTAVPVTTADVLAATTIYFTPYKGNRIALYNGSTGWILRTFSELSLAVPATTSQMYDMFAFDNSGVVAIEALAWTNDTTRATALVLQNGVLVKSGATTRRYIGSFRTTTVSGQTEDSLAKRYVWNYYNRVRRAMRAALETTDSWTYTTATFRQANANAANQLDFIIGVSEDLIEALVAASAANSQAAAASSKKIVSVGLDSTTTASSDAINSLDSPVGSTASPANSIFSRYKGNPPAGRHFLAWLEYSEAVGTGVWYGDSGLPGISQSGISGELLG